MATVIEKDCEEVTNGNFATPLVNNNEKDDFDFSPNNDNVQDRVNEVKMDHWWSSGQGVWTIIFIIVLVIAIVFIATAKTLSPMQKGVISLLTILFVGLLLYVINLNRPTPSIL